MSDPVKKPDHYTWHPSGVECKDIVGAFGFNRGSAIKYIWRAGRKGDEIQDLEKAIESLKNEVLRLNLERAREEERAQDWPGFD